MSQSVLGLLVYINISSGNEAASEMLILDPHNDMRPAQNPYNGIDVILAHCVCATHVTACAACYPHCMICSLNVCCTKCSLHVHCSICSMQVRCAICSLYVHCLTCSLYVCCSICSMQVRCVICSLYVCCCVLLDACVYCVAPAWPVQYFPKLGVHPTIRR